MERFLELCCQRLVGIRRFKHVAMPLTPGGIGDFRHHILQVLPVGVVAVVNGNRIVLVTEVSPVGEQINGAGLPLSRLLKNALSHGVNKRRAFISQEIRSQKSRGRPAFGPERAALRSAYLSDSSSTKGHEDFVTELVSFGGVARVAQGARTACWSRRHLTRCAQALRDPQAAAQTVLVKAILPVRAAKPCAIPPIDIRPALLGLHTRQCELWMRVIKAAQYAVGVDRRRVVQGDAKGLGRIQALQNIHVVGDGGAPVTGLEAIIPARPRSLKFGQQPGVGVQNDFVVAVGQGAQYRPLVLGRVTQHCQRLVGVCGDDDLIERVFAAHF